MRVELKHIKGGLLEQEYTCDPADFPDLVNPAVQGDVGYQGPISVRLRFRQSARMVEVDGCLEATLTLVCGRCLTTFEYELVEPVAMTFVPEAEEDEAAEEREIDQLELGMIPYRDDCLELLIPLQEQLLMAVPIRALCSSDCKGLCPECGADGNLAACGCEKKLFNSKFGVLAKLKK